LENPWPLMSHENEECDDGWLDGLDDDGKPWCS
jgi:hypothetical protein